MSETRGSTKPRHSVVFEQIQREIADGRYQPGDRLPTEAELVRRFDVSRTTITRALKDLEHLGVLRRRRGSGTYVSDSGQRSPDLGFFAPFVESGDGLPHVEGLIHQHLADLAGQNHATLNLQCLTPGERPLEERMLAAAEQVIRSKVRGVLYYPAELPPDQMHLNRLAVDRLIRAGLTVVLIDRDIVGHPDRSEFTRIGYDNRRGGFRLTDHLIRVGCRRIAFVGIPEVSTAVADRLAGYHEAHRAHGFAADDRLVRMADEVDLTEPFCRALLEETRPDAIICKMDRFAAIVGRHLMALGVTIPSDVKMAGFDDDPIAELLPVPLTTIRLPARPFARAAYEAILSRIEEPTIDPRQIIIDTHLVVRESTTGKTR